MDSTSRAKSSRILQCSKHPPETLKRKRGTPSPPRYLLVQEGKREQAAIKDEDGHFCPGPVLFCSTTTRLDTHSPLRPNCRFSAVFMRPLSLRFATGQHGAGCVGAPAPCMPLLLSFCCAVVRLPSQIQRICAPSTYLWPTLHMCCNLASFSPLFLGTARAG